MSQALTKSSLLDDFQGKNHTSSLVEQVRSGCQQQQTPLSHDEVLVGSTGSNAEKKKLTADFNIYCPWVRFIFSLHRDRTFESRINAHWYRCNGSKANRLCLELSKIKENAPRVWAVHHFSVAIWPFSVAWTTQGRPHANV